MSRKECLCHLLVGYDKCPLHGTEIRGVPLTDEEFVELAERNRDVLSRILNPAQAEVKTLECKEEIHEGQQIRRPGRPRKADAE